MCESFLMKDEWKIYKIIINKIFLFKKNTFDTLMFQVYVVILLSYDTFPWINPKIFTKIHSIFIEKLDF